MKTLPDGAHAASPLFGDLLWSIMHLCGTPLTINKCLLWFILSGRNLHYINLFPLGMYSYTFIMNS